MITKATGVGFDSPGYECLLKEHIVNCLPPQELGNG